MEITLEKIEIVKDRTGVSYKEAKEALEHNNGSVVDAIIEIEETVNLQGEPRDDDMKSKIFSKIKETANKGNMSRILVKKGDEILLNLPLTVGVLGAVIAPWGVIFGTIAAFGFRCQIEFINDKGQTTDINGKVKSGYDKAMEKGKDMYGKSQGTFEDLKEKAEGAFEGFKDNYGEKFEDLKDAASDKFEQIKDSDNLEELKNKGKDFFESAVKTVKRDAKKAAPEGDIVEAESVVVTEEPDTPAASAEAEKTVKSELDEVLEEIAKENGISTDKE